MSFCSEKELNTFAKRLGASTGIVAGRYQFLTEEWNRVNGLITKFDWINK